MAKRPEPNVITRNICSDDLLDDDASVHVYHQFRMIITSKGVTYVINRVKVSPQVYRDALATLAAGPGQRS